MKKVRLGDILNVRRGTSLSGKYYSAFGNKIRLTLGNFNYPNGGFKENTAKKDLYFIGEVDSKFILQKGDIITPLTEQVSGLLGETAIIPIDNVYVQSGDIGLIIPNEDKLNRNFAYYLVSSSAVKKQLGAGAQQTKIRHTTPEAIKNCTVWLPEMEQQLRITNILGSIDKKIEINKHKIAKLETIAQDIYNYWFVQYEFPDENGKPYKSNGGKFVWNEELKRNLPYNWDTCKLKDCISKISTGLNPRDNFVLNDSQDNKYITVKNLTLQGTINFSDCDYVSNSAMALIHKRSDIQAGDILFASIEPLGRAYYIMENPKNWDINESVFSLRANTEIIPVCFLYMFLRSSAIVAKMERLAFGSIFNGIRISVINDMEIALPQKNILTKFENLIEPILKEQHKLEAQVQQLIQTKNELLPLLMNGQVTVSENTNSAVQFA